MYLQKSRSSCEKFASDGDFELLSGIVVLKNWMTSVTFSFHLFGESFGIFGRSLLPVSA